MKTLIIYYSLDGNTDFIAKIMAKELSADILELKPKKEISNKGFMKLFWGGKQILFKEKPELQDFDIDLDNYDNIILGSPVWVGTFAPAFKSFFEQVKIENKKVGLVCCYGGGPSKIFEDFKKQLVNCEIKGEIGFQDPLKLTSEENKQKAIKWCQGLF